MIVYLTKIEALKAQLVGARRHAEHERAGRFDPAGERGLQSHVEGACGEFAASKGLGLAWVGMFRTLEEWDIERDDLPDIAHCEVRTTAHVNGRLRVWVDEQTVRPLVLVRMFGLYVYRLAGWSYAEPVKRPAYWEKLPSGQSCYYAPNRLLRSIESLPRQ